MSGHAAVEAATRVHRIAVDLFHGEPVNVGFAAYYESLGRVDLMKNHPDEKPVFISGKDVRATLLQGEMGDPRIMRESTSEILAAAMATAS